MSDVLIILGTSRQGGSTSKAVLQLTENTDAEVVDLLSYDVGCFDYDYNNRNDDFEFISKKMLKATKIIFATPVYWYAMSAQMKTYFDRLSDLLEIRKDDGKALKGKYVYLLADGQTDDELPNGFEVPFERTADYFNMKYLGKCFLKVDSEGNILQDKSDDLLEFKDRVFA